MKPLNVYYFGEDRSHCSSCWEQSDEDVQVLLTTLTLEEIKDRFYSYCWNLETGKVSYENFFHEILEECQDDKSNYKISCFLFSIEGTSWCPDIHGNIGEDYDVGEYLKPNDLEDISELKKIWKKREKEIEEEDKRRKEKERKERERKEKNAEKQRKYRAKKKEYENYLILKDKWEGKELPPEPKTLEESNEAPKPKNNKLTYLEALLKKSRESKNAK